MKAELWYILRAFERKFEWFNFNALYSALSEEENEFCNCWRSIFSSVIHENEFWVYLIKAMSRSHIFRDPF